MKIKQGKFSNSSGSTIPAFGVFRVSASSVGTDGTVNVTASQPDGTDSLYYINQSVATANGDTGSHFTEEDIFPVLYDETKTTPVTGDLIGPQSGSFKASAGNSRWRVVYGDPDTLGFVLCRRHHSDGSCGSLVRYQMLVDATAGSIVFPFQINTTTATVTIDWNEQPLLLRNKFVAAFAAEISAGDITVTGFNFPFGSMDILFDPTVFTDPNVGLIQDPGGTITDTLTSYVETRLRIIRVNNS